MNELNHLVALYSLVFQSFVLPPNKQTTNKQHALYIQNIRIYNIYIS